MTFVGSTAKSGSTTLTPTANKTVVGSAGSTKSTLKATGSSLPQKDPAPRSGSASLQQASPKGTPTTVSGSSRSDAPLTFASNSTSPRH